MKIRRVLQDKRISLSSYTTKRRGRPPPSPWTEIVLSSYVRLDPFRVLSRYKDRERVFVLNHSVTDHLVSLTRSVTLPVFFFGKQTSKPLVGFECILILWAFGSRRSLHCDIMGTLCKSQTQKMDLHFLVKLQGQTPVPCCEPYLYGSHH